MYKTLLDLPPEILYYTIRFFDRKSFLLFGSVNLYTRSITTDNLSRASVGVFPYQAAIPNHIYISEIDEQDPPIGSIICVERPGTSICSLDIPVIVVYNQPWSQYIGVIMPSIFIDIDKEPLSNIKYGKCRIESGAYLHREHFRLARSSKRLIATMQDEIVQKLQLPLIESETYYVSKIARYDLKSHRKLDNMKESLKMGLTLSDAIYLNPEFRFYKSVDKYDIDF